MTISPPSHGELEAAIRRAVARFRPRSILETGTYLGEGTTRILYESAKETGPFELITIEVHREYHAVAQMRYRDCPEVRCLHGLSVGREDLPTAEWIDQHMVKNNIPGIYYDHPSRQRVGLYMSETDCEEGVPDDLLVKMLDHSPDLIVLDSAGHIGHLEFQTVVQRATPPYVLVLDDCAHIKHFASAQFIRQAPAEQGWSIIEEGSERFGWMIALRLPLKSG